MILMACCSMCGEPALPLPGWKPIETVNADGSITVQGTPCFCACTAEKAEPSSSAPRPTRSILTETPEREG